MACSADDCGYEVETDPPKADNVSKPCGCEAGTAGIDNRGVAYLWEERDDWGRFRAGVCSVAPKSVVSSSVVSSSEALLSRGAPKSPRERCRACAER
jgi:hypothetical protein